MGLPKATDDELGRGLSSTVVTPHATNELAPMRALHVNVGGNVVGLLRNDTGSPRTFVAAAGDRLPYDFKVVHTDTTATGLHAIR